MSSRGSVWALACLLWAGPVLAQPSPYPSPQPADRDTEEPAPPPAAPVQPPAAPALIEGFGAPQVLRVARERFEFGEYEAVVLLLQPFVDAAQTGSATDPDQLEALRTYGIASILTGRRTAAEGAFLLLLREQPGARLDPALVRPEAVEFFDAVRARRARELERAAGRRYLALNFLPPAGQLQNRQPGKAAVVGGAAALLLGTNITTTILLNDWQGPTREYAGHQGEARAMMALNVASFVGLAGALIYSVVDGLVIGARLNRVRRSR